MIDKETVSHIANLARLNLSDEELETYTKQLSAVLDHFEQLEKVDTSGVEPLLTPSPIVEAPREDKVIASVGAEKLLENAPSKSGNLFKVPPVV